MLNGISLKELQHVNYFPNALPEANANLNIVVGFVKNYYVSAP